MHLVTIRVSVKVIRMAHFMLLHRLLSWPHRRNEMALLWLLIHCIRQELPSRHKEVDSTDNITDWLQHDYHVRHMIGNQHEIYCGMADPR